jgi:hypothetical protein
VNIRVNDRLVVQVAEFLRATMVSVFPRGNVETVVAFESAWTFDTEAEAAATCLGFRATLPDQADARFIWGHGASQRVITLRDAVVEMCAPVAFHGKTVRMAFSVHGGMLESSGVVGTFGARIWNTDLEDFCIMPAVGALGAQSLVLLEPEAGTTFTGRSGGALVYNPDIEGTCLLVARGSAEPFTTELTLAEVGGPGGLRTWNTELNREAYVICRGADPYTVEVLETDNEVIHI